MQLRALLSVKMTCSDFFLCDIFGEYDEENPQKNGGVGERGWVYEKMDCKTWLEHPQTVGKGEAAPTLVPSPFWGRLWMIILSPGNVRVGLWYPDLV